MFLVGSMSQVLRLEDRGLMSFFLIILRDDIKLGTGYIAGK